MDRESTVDLNDVIDLSVVELYILNYLVKVSSSTVRFAVFNELNDQLGSVELSRSSFYNSLKKLEEKGFLTITDNPDVKGSLVGATSLAREALKQINIFSIWGSIDTDYLIQTVIEDNLDHFIPVKLQLFVSYDFPLNIPNLQFISSRSKKTSILATDELYEKYSRQFGSDIDHTRILDKIIREPDGFFDRVVLYRFHPMAVIFDLDISGFLSEIFRVLDEGGEVWIVSLEPPTSNNLLLDTLITDILQSEMIEEEYTHLIVKSMRSHGFTLNYRVDKQGIILYRFKK